MASDFTISRRNQAYTIGLDPGAWEQAKWGEEQIISKAKKYKKVCLKSLVNFLRRSSLQSQRVFSEGYSGEIVISTQRDANEKMCLVNRLGTDTCARSSPVCTLSPS